MFVCLFMLLKHEGESDSLNPLLIQQHSAQRPKGKRHTDSLQPSAVQKSKKRLAGATPCIRAMARSVGMPSLATGTS